MNKIKRWDELLEIVKLSKASGKKVVFTNGCFDIIHAGHVHYLRQAKSLGDLLIVAINSDESVKKLKPERPIISEKERIEVVAALEMVDYVTVFKEDTPYELIKILKPDVLVKGGDWKVEEIVGSDIVKEVYSLTYKQGISTTEIIKKIIDKYCKNR